MAKNFDIRTPHAAILVWNYIDRIGSDGVSNLNDVEPTIISTVSCVSIETAKSKGNPVGTFRFVLAPFKNWVSTLTTGSWCAILMSNKPITKESLRKADPQLVKMFGKIVTVRADTKQVGDTRQTLFYVTGEDWGHIFNNVMYIDNLLASANDPQSQGNAAAVAIRNAAFGNKNSPQFASVKDLLTSIVNIFGNDLQGFSDSGKGINRLAKSVYDFVIPKPMVDFFGFINENGDPDKSQLINKILNIQTGRLVGVDDYDEVSESAGYLNPFSLQGTNTFWQILLDNSNPALNEMYNEIDWSSNGPALTLYNRIKPFSYKKQSTSDVVNNLRSFFYNVKTHIINPLLVQSVNAGTNWRDKYNFIELKPQFQEFNIIANWTKQKTQEADQNAFNREGFRPLIVGIKQIPFDFEKSTPIWNNLTAWTKLMREWYFDTHKLLNGTLVMRGSTEYIAVGNNIKFDAGLINPTPNVNKATSNKKVNQYVLAHIENVSHSFFVDEEGARQYVTTIQFVRGIIVNKNNTLVGEGSLDTFADGLSETEDRNSENTVTTSEVDDPDRKIRGA